MTAPGSLSDFCRYALDYEEGRYADDPVRLGTAFREYVGLQRTPGLARTINLVRSLGIKVEAVDYLNTGGTNMTANGCWYIHYSAKDRPATQKFDIFHELYEIIHKSFVSLSPGFGLLGEPQLSRNADRFAAATLIPPRFFLRQASATGCDLVRLSEDLELSHHCLLIALGQHFVDIPLIGILYEYRPRDISGAAAEMKDFVATVVVKTGRARRIKELCGLQTVPARNSHPQTGSLVCAAVNGGRPVLWQSTHIEDSPAILVRPLLSIGLEPYRVILVAVPKEEFGMILPQVERIEPVSVNGDISCPSENKCRISGNCHWRSIGGYYEQ
ncbi:MAG: ImmA/IrrE family metallo-endopeptidase [Dehalococcoidales bacterium]|nr:ImmA/IrrE family metallo-endopeptidase [Dehalococcoidales bacterium]